jgi:predicted DNA-binding transcriptional regulator AlpA
MPHLFFPQEEDFKKWIREAIREERKGFAADRPKDFLEGEAPLLNRKEIAGYLRISLVTLHDWMNRGLPCHRKGGRVFFLKAEVLEWVKTKHGKDR